MCSPMCTLHTIQIHISFFSSLCDTVMLTICLTFTFSIKFVFTSCTLDFSLIFLFFRKHCFKLLPLLLFIVPFSIFHFHFAFDFSFDAWFFCLLLSIFVIRIRFLRMILKINTKRLWETK